MHSLLDIGAELLKGRGLRTTFDDKDHVVGAKPLLISTKDLAQAPLPMISDHGVAYFSGDRDAQAGKSQLVWGRVDHEPAALGASPAATGLEKLSSLF